MKKCYHCGKLINDTANFCPYCGTTVNTSNNATPNSQRQDYLESYNKPAAKGGNKSTIIIIAAILLALVGGWYYKNNTTTSSVNTAAKGNPFKTNSSTNTKPKSTKTMSIEDLSFTSPTSKVTAQNAAPENKVKSIVNIMAGNWYDQDGNLVLKVSDGKINDCTVSKGYDLIGNVPMGTITLKIASTTERYIRLGWSIFDPGSKRSTLVVAGKDLILHKKDDNWKYESIKGVSLDMTKEQVRKILGNPTNKNATAQTDREDWHYQNLGLTVEFSSPIGPSKEVTGIILLSSGPSHFDKSGLKADSSLSDFARSYGMDKTPRRGSIGIGIGHSEYLDFNDYPNSVHLRSNPRP